jgi:hypothetical protein
MKKEMTREEEIKAIAAFIASVRKLKNITAARYELDGQESPEQVIANVRRQLIELRKDRLQNAATADERASIRATADLYLGIVARSLPPVS